jgi:FkbM family methyltransferase
MKRIFDLYRTIKFILNHPLNAKSRFKALKRFLSWQFSNVFYALPTIFCFTEKSKLIAWKGLAGATGNLYCGLDEFEDMGFLLHFLRENDIFVDIGANIGSYTVLASAEIGAISHSFEPHPTTYDYLIDNLSINRIQAKTKAYNLGLGSHKGILKFTSNLDSTNHIATDTETNTINVEVNTLDNIMSDNCPILFKIDVEGFETEVLKGSENILKNKSLKAVIIELNGSGSRYGYDENKIREKFEALGFLSYRYNPLERKLTAAEPNLKTLNTIYIRDMNFIIERTTNSRMIKVNGISF